MAGSNTPARGRRSKNNYLDAVGKKGRVTGLEVPEHERNEDDMEDPKAFFSSATRTATSRSTRTGTRKSDMTISSSEDMEIQESSGPSIAEALSAGPSLHKPPPMGRSPLKTNLGATPKRPSSIGAPSTARLSNTSSRASTSGPTNRRLNFSQNSPRSTLKVINRSPRNLVTKVNGNVSKGSGVYSLSPSKSPTPAAGKDGLADDISGDDDHYENGNAAMGDDSLPAIENDEISDQLDGMEDAGEHEHQPMHGEYASAIARNEKGQERAATGSRTRQSGASDDLQVDDDQAEDSHAEELPQQGNLEAEPEALARPVKRRRRRVVTKQAATRKRGNKPTLKKWRKPFAKRDQNQEANGTPKTQSPFKDPGASHNLQRERHETPYEEGTGSHTRSGRLTYKPLAHWKGERAVFQSRSLDPTITEIVRMEDVTPQKRSRPRSDSVKPRRRKRKYTVFEDDDDEDDCVEPWETEEGVVHGPVRTWDAELGAGVNEGEVTQIAYSAQGIDPRDVPTANFRYAKTSVGDFFGSGVLEMPPQGFKRSKNSRKMFMSFCVIFGKVSVDVAGTKFIITKGGVWNVPRGNLYSIENDTDQAAKIFFAQGCEIDRNNTRQEASQSFMEQS